jgi:hypothetical protein
MIQEDMQNVSHLLGNCDNPSLIIELDIGDALRHASLMPATQDVSKY